MPGGQPQVLSSRFRGLNRLLASYMLDPAESPDTADAGQYGNVSQVLGPRGGRKPIQALSFPIKGVVPLNLSWLKLQLIATADGSITPYTIVDPLYFNDFGSYLGYGLNGRYVTDGGGPYNVDGNGNSVSSFYANASFSGNMLSMTLTATNVVNSGVGTTTGINVGIKPVFSNSGGSIQFTVTNTGSTSPGATCGVYGGALVNNAPVNPTAQLYGPGDFHVGTASPSAGANLYTLHLAVATRAGTYTETYTLRFDMVYTP